MWPFKRKPKQQITVDAWLVREFEATARYQKRRDAFERSRLGKTVKRHLELSEAIANAPASRKEAICQQQVDIAADAMEGLRQDHELLNDFRRDSRAETYPFRVPGHRGFQQLAIICEREKRFDEAIALCHEAKRQGWNGDWDKRIERCEGKRAKAGR